VCHSDGRGKRRLDSITGKELKTHLAGNLIGGSIALLPPTTWGEASIRQAVRTAILARRSAPLPSHMNGVLGNLPRSLVSSALVFDEDFQAFFVLLCISLERSIAEGAKNYNKRACSRSKVAIPAAPRWLSMESQSFSRVSSMMDVACRCDSVRTCDHHRRQWMIYNAIPSFAEIRVVGHANTSARVVNRGEGRRCQCELWLILGNEQPRWRASMMPTHDAEQAK